MVICKDCKYAKREFFDVLTRNWDWLECTHPESVIVNNVSGEETRFFCRTERRSLIGKCGPEGKLFEAKS